MLSNHHVLVVDDQPLTRKVLKSMLAGRGCTSFSEAANGQEARDQMQQNAPTLVLCDINMSPGDGFSFLQDLRSGSHCDPQVPVIFLTCNSEASFIERAKDMGADGYLLKPITANDLADQIGKALKRRP